MVQFRTDGKGLIWSGIEVVFPEKYAVDKWYHLTGYDVWLGEESQSGMVRRSTNSIQVSPHDFAGNDFILQADMTFVCENAALDCADGITGDYLFLE